MKHGESDVKRQISIQGSHLSAFWNYFWKIEGSFKHDKEVRLLCQPIYQILCKCKNKFCRQ